VSRHTRPLVTWKKTDGEERPLRRRSYWIALPGGAVAVGFYGFIDDLYGFIDDPPEPRLPTGKAAWRYLADRFPVQPPPTHWAEIDVPAHPEPQARRV
jgi:hypothetical protein